MNGYIHVSLLSWMVDFQPHRGRNTVFILSETINQAVPQNRCTENCTSTEELVSDVRVS